MNFLLNSWNFLLNFLLNSSNRSGSFLTLPLFPDIGWPSSFYTEGALLTFTGLLKRVLSCYTHLMMWAAHTNYCHCLNNPAVPPWLYNPDSLTRVLFNLCFPHRLSSCRLHASLMLVASSTPIGFLLVSEYITVLTITVVSPTW